MATMGRPSGSQQPAPKSNKWGPGEKRKNQKQRIAFLQKRQKSRFLDQAALAFTQNGGNRCMIEAMVARDEGRKDVDSQKNDRDQDSKRVPKRGLTKIKGELPFS